MPNVPYREFPGGPIKPAPKDPFAQPSPSDIAAAHLAKQTGAFRQADAPAINKIVSEHKPPKAKKHANHRKDVAKQRRVEESSHRKTDRR
jgi:hypothetical protein